MDLVAPAGLSCWLYKACIACSASAQQAGACHKQHLALTLEVLNYFIHKHGSLVLASSWKLQVASADLEAASAHTCLHQILYIWKWSVYILFSCTLAYTLLHAHAYMHVWEHRIRC